VLTLRNRIAQLRTSRHYTQDELASLLGISRAALSHYEKGRREPDYDTLIKIADLFQVSLDYIMCRTDDPRVHLSDETRQFADSLELSDEDILSRFSFTIDGKKLTPEESRRFIAFVRAERMMQN
jgi:transcriptional regulator with XRE-family HTH domain